MKIIFMLMFSVLAASYAIAGPIQDIRLKYSIEEQQLHVEIAHISRDDREDYIRKIVVFRNGKEEGLFRYRMQTSPVKFETDIRVAAEPGDELTVMAYVSEGGVKSASVIVEDVLKEDQPASGKWSPTD